MLGVGTGLVTILLASMAASFARKRLWRGPALFKAAREHVRARGVPGDVEASGGGGERAFSGDDTRGGGDGVAKSVGAVGDGGSSGTAAVPALDGCTSAKSGAGAAESTPKPRNACVRLGRWFQAHSPFRRGRPEDAVNCVDACISADGFASWTLPRVIATEAAAFPLAAFRWAAQPKRGYSGEDLAGTGHAAGVPPSGA